jgi:predicted anti-sigma-YlaC factor YlaD
MIFEHGWISSSLIFWGAIVLFVLIGSYFKYRTRASEHRMLEKLAESGQSLTPELLSRLGNGHGERRGSPVKAGIFLMCIGIAIAVFFWAMGGGGNLFQGGGYVPNWLPVLGIFPFMVGLAKFLGGLTDRRRDE